MKRTISLFFLIHFTGMLHAQTADSVYAGEYYLRGEAETAAGFKLNNNHSFQFFFSYGALDRQAEGTWRIADSTIVFNSKKNSPDFSLVASKKTADRGFLIKVICANPQLNKYFLATLTANGKTQTVQADSKGHIRFAAKQGESIVLFCEMCPEKKSAFSLKDQRNNELSFRVAPTLFDVNFQAFSMRITNDEINGPLPFSADHVCHFERRH